MYQRRNRGKPQFNRVPRVFVGAARFILAKVPPREVMAPPSTHSQAVLPNSGTLVLDRIDRHEKDFEIFVSTNQLSVLFANRFPRLGTVATPGAWATFRGRDCLFGSG